MMWLIIYLHVSKNQGSYDLSEPRANTGLRHDWETQKSNKIN